MSIVTLPSGLSGEIRGLKGKEAKLLTDQVAVKRGIYVDQILNACWTRTLDPGPYPESEKPDWSKVLNGDRFAALIQFRALTFGSDYTFKTPCTSCGEPITITLDVSKELACKPLSAADRQCFISGNRFTVTFKGKKIVFRLPIGEDEQKASRGSVDTMYLATLNSRIYEIEDVPVLEKLQFLEEAPLGDLMELQNMFDEHDCGVETDLLGIDCPSCGATQESVKIPFGAAFLAPKKR